MGKNFGWRSAFPNRVRMPEFLTGPPLPRNKIEHEALLAGREGAPSLLLQKRRNCVSIGNFPFHMSDSEQAPFFEPDEMPAEVPLPEPPPERSAAPAAENSAGEPRLFSGFVFGFDESRRACHALKRLNGKEKSLALMDATVRGKGSAAGVLIQRQKIHAFTSGRG